MSSFSTSLIYGHYQDISGRGWLACVRTTETMRWSCKATAAKKTGSWEIAQLARDARGRNGSCLAKLSQCQSFLEDFYSSSADVKFFPFGVMELFLQDLLLVPVFNSFFLRLWCTWCMRVILATDGRPKPELPLVVLSKSTNRFVPMYLYLTK